MLGGAEIFVRGQGMANMATSNFPRYVVNTMSNLPVDGWALTGKYTLFNFSTETDSSKLSLKASKQEAISYCHFRILI